MNRFSFYQKISLSRLSRIAAAAALLAQGFVGDGLAKLLSNISKEEGKEAGKEREGDKS